MSENINPIKKTSFSDLEAATQRHARFFDLVKDVKSKADLEMIRPSITGLVTAAEYEVNTIIQDAGKIPEGDPRHEQFDKGNQILAEYERLARLP
jgi:hypothetical protein